MILKAQGRKAHAVQLWNHFQNRAWTCWPGVGHSEFVSQELDDEGEGVEAEV